MYFYIFTRYRLTTSNSALAPHGQKVSLERGTSTRSKKNPGKRPEKGG